MIYLYHLSRVAPGAGEIGGFVVAATSTEAARNFAASAALAEGPEAWLVPAMSVCVVVGEGLPEEPPGIILRSYLSA